MVLYDLDDKLLVADHSQIRLWNFEDNKEDIPELVTLLETKDKISCVKVNKYSEETGDR
jgi:hypothetical protein